MIYKENIGLERIDCEYKVFNFNPLKISIEDSKKYLSNGIFCFNNSVDDTIRNYLEIYLPKYLSSFFNPLSTLKEGYLYFGIDNNGKVIGIPYIGVISKNLINNKIDEIFTNRIKFPNETIKNKVRKCIDIEIIKIDKSKINYNLLTNKKTSYLRYVDELNKIKLKNKIYKKKRDMWNKMVDLDNLKLCEMINDLETRKYIWKYIKIKSKYLISGFINKYSHLEKYCDVENYWSLMSNIKSNKFYEPLKQGGMLEITDNNLDIYKWTASWKDSKFSMLKKAKPKKPTKKIDSYYPIFLLSQVSKMIPEWIKKNDNLDLYVIKIIFNTNQNWLALEYKDIENNWKYSYRTILNNEPVSLSYNSLSYNS
jgi:hypothetical protein